MKGRRCGETLRSNMNNQQKTKTVKAYGIVTKQFKEEWSAPVEIGYFKSELMGKANDVSGFGYIAKVIPITITYKI